MRFIILPKIHDFTDAQGHVYRPGDTVELPEELYLGLDWLKPVEEARRVDKPAAEKPRTRRRRVD